MDNFNPFSLSGKTILVTGASSGIGKTIAFIFSQMNAKLVITGRNIQRLNETLSSLEGNDHLAIPADLTITKQVNELVEKCPKLDGVVHNAGIGNRVPCRMIQKENIDHVLQSNFVAPVFLQTTLLDKKKINSGASIVFTASMAAKYPSIGNATYSASKGAIISYAKCLGLELAPRKIRVNCICPGMVWTDLITKDGLSREELEQAQMKYPLKRYGSTVDIANLAIYLLSNASSWMTGSVIEINGGGEGSLI